jgi:predicted small secreted protein
MIHRTGVIDWRGSRRGFYCWFNRGKTVSRIGLSQGRKVSGVWLCSRFRCWTSGGQDSNIGCAFMAEPPARLHQTQGELLMTRLIALLLIVGTAALAACNTVAGAGQDLSKGGNAITNSADKHNAE